MDQYITTTPFPPEGFVDRHEAARMLGVSGGTWTRWVREGRVTCSQRHQRPSDGHTCVLYPKAALERLRDQIEQIGKPYPDPQRPGVWRVPLNGYGEKREALIDEADLPVVQGVSRCWRARAVKHGGGGEVVLHVNRKQRPLQRLIMEAIGGVIDPALRIGFVNGDPLDCRRTNLVLRTQAQVAYAARPPKMRQGKARTSTFKGVGFDRKCGQWRACITRGQVQTTIGTFDDPTTAAEAFDDCARLWYGEHAYLNFPDRALSDDRRIWAQGVLERGIRRQRRRERRVKRLGRLLRREARATMVAPTQSSTAASVLGPTVGRRDARKLLGVPRANWRRWEKKGWIVGGRDAKGRKVYPVALIKHLMEACGRLKPPYPDPQRANVWRVPLAFSGKHKEVLIDAASLGLIEGGWCMMSGTRAQTGADAYVSYWSASTKQHGPLRRLIADVTDEGLQVGHWNDDPMDCRRENLVVVTPAQRSYRNHKIKIRNGVPTTSAFKGVSWHKGGKKWTAMIHGGGKPRYLGLYVREEEAALAYDNAARELYGEHARLNFPDGLDAWLEAQAARMERAEAA